MCKRPDRTPAVQRKPLSRPPVPERRLEAWNREWRETSWLRHHRLSHRHTGQPQTTMPRGQSRSPAPREVTFLNPYQHPCFGHNPFVFAGFTASARYYCHAPKTCQSKTAQGSDALRPLALRHCGPLRASPSTMSSDTAKLPSTRNRVNDWPNSAPGPRGSVRPEGPGSLPVPNHAFPGFRAALRQPALPLELEPPGTRTQHPRLKRPMLCRLS